MKTNYHDETNGTILESIAQVIIYSGAIIFGIFYVSSCEAQILTWTVPGTYANPTVKVTQDANNILVYLNGFPDHKIIPKNSFSILTKTITVHDTVWRVLDIKQSSEYVELAKQFADAMAEREYERLQKEEAQAALVQKQAQYAEAVRQMKLLNERLKQDTIVWVRFKKTDYDFFYTLPVRKP